MWLDRAKGLLTYRPSNIFRKISDNNAKKVQNTFLLNFDLILFCSFLLVWWLIKCLHLRSSLWKYMYKDIFNRHWFCLTWLHLRERNLSRVSAAVRSYNKEKYTLLISSFSYRLSHTASSEHGNIHWLLLSSAERVSKFNNSLGCSCTEVFLEFNNLIHPWLLFFYLIPLMEENLARENLLLSVWGGYTWYSYYQRSH